MSSNTTFASVVALFSESVRYNDLKLPAQTTLALALITASLSVCVAYVNSGKTVDDGIPHIGGIPFVGSWAFFTRRLSFLDEGISRFGKMFAFNILHHRIVALSTEEARRVFFASKELNITEGYKVLFGAAPDITEIGMQGEHEHGITPWFVRRLSSILRKDRLAIAIPLMIGDLDRQMKKWGHSGTFDPFDDLYSMVFQLTVRGGTCREIADDEVAVKRFAKLYWDIEHGTTPTSMLLPWFPSHARMRKNKAMFEVYLMLKKVIDERKASGRTEADAVQVLLDEGDGVNDIVAFVMNMFFAAIINTGVMASWILLHLQSQPEWKAKVAAAVREFVKKHASQPGIPLFEQLGHVPPQVWDEDLAVVELCLRETIRVVLSGAALRRTMTDDFVIDGKRMPRGTFLAFSTSTTHMNPNIYADPERWDPSRYALGEDTKQIFAYVGWGAGRHPCLGMRFAKLEIKAILAMFLTQYEYDVVDAAGKSVSAIPPPDRNNLFQSPPIHPVYIRYRSILNGGPDL